MRIKINLEAKVDEIPLPIHYNKALHSFLFKRIETNLAKWFKDASLEFIKHTYKYLTFSRIYGSYQLHPKHKKITFEGPISFQVSGHNSELICALAENLLKRNRVQLHTTRCYVTTVESMLPPSFAQPSLTVKALSPISIHSTETLENGSLFTHYYGPTDPSWADRILAELSKKAEALQFDNPQEALHGAHIKPLYVKPRDRKIIMMRNFAVQGWLGYYTLQLPSLYQRLAYDIGLGSKNHFGFGFLEESQFEPMTQP